jgi:hypothetical protein
MADPKGVKATTPADGVGVDACNMISVAMEDLTEEDRRAMECELEEEMAERRCKKLACFQKTRHSIVKKADMAATSSTTVNYLLSPEDFVQLVDVTVASKYKADLTQFT